MWLTWVNVFKQNTKSLIMKSNLNNFKEGKDEAFDIAEREIDLFDKLDSR